MYKVKKSRREERDNRFQFELEGVEYSVPLLKFVPVRVIELFENGSTISALVAASDDEDTRDAIRKLDAEQLEGLVEAWKVDSGIETGE